MIKAYREVRDAYQFMMEMKSLDKQADEIWIVDHRKQTHELYEQAKYQYEVAKDNFRYLLDEYMKE